MNMTRYVSVPVYADLQEPVNRVLLQLGDAVQLMSGFDLKTRKLIVTVSFAAFGRPSNVMIEYQGTPVRTPMMFPFGAPELACRVGKQTELKSCIKKLAVALTDLMELPEISEAINERLRASSDEQRSEMFQPLVVHFGSPWADAASQK